MSFPSNSNSISDGQRNGGAARTRAPDKSQTDDGFAEGAIIKSLAVELTSVYPLPSRPTIRRGRTGPSISEDELKVPDLSVDQVGYLNLTTHSDNFLADPIDLKWGEEDSEKRGPVLATTRHPTQRNAIGAHSGSYCLYRALAVACGKLNPNYLPKLEATRPVCEIGPFDSWSDPSKIGTMDPWGHMVTSEYRPWLNKGYDIRPTIAVTKAHIDLPEVKEAVRVGRLKPDGKILNEDGQSFITKCAVEPVWYLPEIARRFEVDEVKLRETLFRETNMMFPELVTREDLKAFLPPIGGLTIYIFGDPASIPDEDIPLTVRVHDECNGSDVFGSDICTCRPYLTHAIEECIKTAQEGGTGVCIYFRKEGRSLGEVTKYLVYNMRKRQEGGDSAEMYFNCTEQVAGIQDTRFQALMPDALHWLGVTKIHRFISMSDMKYDAIVSTGIKIVERVEIPPELVPKDAQVEIMAKVFKGYHAGLGYVGVNDDTMKNTLGRIYGQASNESVGVNGGADLTRHEPYPDRTSMRRQRGPSISEDELKVPDLSVDQVGYLNLTTHSANFLADPIDLKWGEEDPEKRGPIVATTRQPTQRNAIGAHSGSYCLYRALAVACGKLDPNYLPKLDATRPVCEIGPFESWSDPSKIGTMDPWGHVVTDVYKPWLRKGYDIRPTIAVTEAHIDLPEVREGVRVGRLKPDGKILTEDGQSFITKCAVEPVWYLPEIARRFGVDEVKLRETLFKETNMMYPELVTREDLKVFLPPIGGLTIYIFGDPALIPNEDIPLTVRVHDECNGSDVFGSDICTCRPYLTHAIEECIKTAQEGGTGLCIYFRKEGRSLGEVTKYLVYNMRKRQEGGDSAEKYFNCTEQVAGIQDTRFQALMPDALHWLGVTKIHRFISMSDMKYDAIVSTGIKIVERVEIPPELVPKDAQVEITAKVFQGYHAGLGYVGVNEEALKTTLGRGYDYDEEKSKIPDADTNVT